MVLIITAPTMRLNVAGMYILLADDTEPGYHTDNAAWQPLLHPYQQVCLHPYPQAGTARYQVTGTSDPMPEVTIHSETSNLLGKVQQKYFTLYSRSTSLCTAREGGKYFPSSSANDANEQEGANVLFFTFINPATMDVPAAFQKLGNSSK